MKKETFGRRVAALRKAKGITQIVAATDIGIGRSTLASYERDHDLPGRDTLQAIASFYDVSMDYLTSGLDFGVENSVGGDQLIQDQLLQLKHAWPRIDPDGRLAIATLVRKLATPRRKQV